MNKINTQKIIAIFAVSVLALLANGGYAAADFSAVNLRTGFDSDSDSQLAASIDFDIDNANLESLDNTFDGVGDTGFNLGDGDIDTGDVLAEVLGGNIDNRNNLEVSDLGGSDFDVLAVNDTTGALSDNDSEVDIDKDVDLDNSNDTDLENDLSLCANTGFNEADGAWGSEVDTGDAEADINVENSVNRNFVDLETGLSDVSAEVGNELTGFDSENNAELSIDDSTDVDNHNDADINNDVDVALNTGNNESESAWGGCGDCGSDLFDDCGDCDVNGDSGISTGDAVADIKVENTANVNSVDINGGVDADVEVGNSGTGAFSDNDAEAEINSELNVDNHNDADINNDVDVALNTGNNLSDNGFGGGDIETGDAEAQVQIENAANVNELNLDLNNDLDLSATNSCTGEGSDNDAEAEVNNSVEINNTNNADINNDVEISSNTGGNVSGDICGGGVCGGDISTGDSVIKFGVQNSANGNSF